MGSDRFIGPSLMLSVECWILGVGLGFDFGCRGLGKEVLLRVYDSGVFF